MSISICLKVFDRNGTTAFPCSRVSISVIRDLLWKQGQLCSLLELHSRIRGSDVVGDILLFPTYAMYIVARDKETRYTPSRFCCYGPGEQS